MTGMLKTTKRLAANLLVCFLLLPSLLAAPGGKQEESSLQKEATVVSVKIDGAISSPQLSILRRGLKEAKKRGADLFIIDMDTPGGDLSTTLKMMEELSKYGGKTACYVNKNAISAGSFIAVACDKIYFAPEGTMGAAEAVSATGEDIGDSMSRKVSSFLGAKVRSICGENSRRAQIQRAMADPNFELKIGNNLLKPKGQLLTLTAQEAAQIVDGKPLLADGIAESAEGLAAEALKIPASAIKLFDVGIMPAEKLAKFSVQIAPLILGIGFFLIFMEIKAGTFGILGLCAVGLFLSVFVATNISGLAGYEATAIFAAGVILVAVEFIFMPGLLFLSIPGGLLVLASMVWTLSDMNPNFSFLQNIEALAWGGIKFLAAVCIAAILVALFGKLVEKSSLWKKIELRNTDSAKGRAPSEFGSLGAENESSEMPQIPCEGVCVTDLIPSGRVRIGEKIFDSTAQFGHIKSGTKVLVVGKKDFNFVVKKM